MTKKELKKTMQWVKENIHNKEEFAEKIKALETGIYAVIAINLGFQKFAKLPEVWQETYYNALRDKLLEVGLIFPMDFGPGYADCEVFGYKGEITFKVLAIWAYDDVFEFGVTPIYGDENGNVSYGERTVINN